MISQNRWNSTTGHKNPCSHNTHKRLQRRDQTPTSYKLQCRAFDIETRAVEFLKWKCASLSLDKASPVFSSFFTRQDRTVFWQKNTENSLNRESDQHGRMEENSNKKNIYILRVRSGELTFLGRRKEDLKKGTSKGNRATYLTNLCDWMAERGAGSFTNG